MSHPTRSKKALVLAGLVVVVAGLAWLFPPFHIVPLKGVQEQQQAAEFDAAAAAGVFWETKLLPATARAIEVKRLSAAASADGNVVRPAEDGGVVGSGAFLVKGTGRVTTVEEEAVVVAIDGSDAKVRLFTGLLFGNTVRDASGLLDVSAYPNSQDFNDLSSQLNKIVETKIAPGLRQQAAVGRAIRFVGCVELEEGTKPESLSVIPLKVDWS